MDNLHPRALKQTAAQRLSQASYNPKKLILFHTGAALAVSFVITLLNFILTRQIDSTGGLSGIALRSILSTAQSALQLAGTVALPFWEIGILYAAMGLARQKPVGPSSLPEGFRRFGPVLRLMLLRAVVVFGIAMVCIYISTGIFMMTPYAQPMLELMLPMMEDSSTLTQAPALDEATLAVFAESMIPLYILFGILFCLVAVPFLYRFRLADYVLMDTKKTGAFAAAIKSWSLTKRNCLKLLRIDLSFWWFYVLQLLTVLLGYGDMLLPALGISLTVSSDVAFFAFYVLYIAGQLALYWWAGSRVETTYALAYDTLLQQPQAPAVQTTPKNQPWDY